MFFVYLTIFIVLFFPSLIFYTYRSFFLSATYRGETP